MMFQMVLLLSDYCMIWVQISLSVGKIHSTKHDVKGGSVNKKCDSLIMDAKSFRDA